MPAREANSSRPIDLFLGPYRSGKTSRLLQELLRFAQDRPFDGALVVVPSARYRNLLSERLLELASAAVASGARRQPGYIGLRIMPFYELCRTVLRAGGVASSLLPDSVRVTIMARLMGDLQAGRKISALSAISHCRGTWSAVLDLIDELQRAALSPQAVLAALERTAAADFPLIELARIYERYWQELARLDCQDQHMLAFKAREVLFAGDRLPLGAAWLAADGFDRFNRLQLEVLSGLARHVERTSITFDYVDESSCHYQRYREEYLWKAESYRQLTEALSPAIEQCQPGESARAQEVFSCLDRYLEMEEIARRCKELIAGGGTTTRGILVVARDLSAYRGAVEAAFQSAGLPYFVDESRTIAEQPVVQLVRALLRCYQKDFARADVIFCLRSRYLDLTALGLAPSDVDDIDDLSLAIRLSGGLERWSSRVLPRLPGRAAEGLGSFFRAVTPPGQTRTQAELCVWTEDLLDRLLVCRTGSGQGGRAGDAESFRALAGLRSVIGNLIHEEVVLGAQPVLYADFVLRFESLLEQTTFRRTSRFREPITICGADVAPNRSYDYVFVAGLLEGEFPRRAGSSGFVSADELARWSRFGVALNNPRHHPAFEPALYASLIERASRKAYLSFPRYDMGSGAEAVPSFLITRGDAEVERAIPFAAPFQGSLARPVSARDAFAGRLWAGADLEALGRQDAPESVGELGRAIASPLAVARARALQQRESVYNGYLVDLVSSGALSVTLPPRWSASRLNDYGSCPFRYWVSRLLGWDRREEPEAGLGAQLRGRVYHKALELFFGRVAAAGLAVRQVSAGQRQEIFEGALSDALLWLESQEEFQPEPFWRYDRLEVRFRLERFLEKEFERLAGDEEPFEPGYFEASFGGQDEDSCPALDLEVDGRRIAIAGVIDRIDIAAGAEAPRIRVVDYKTGFTRYSVSDIEEGRSLQIPVYAMAAERSLIPGASAVEGVYLSVGSGEPVGRFELAGDEGRKLLERSQQTIARLVGGVGRGDFTVRPSAADVCRTCPHDTICRIAELARKEDGDGRTD